MPIPNMRLKTVVVDCPDIVALSNFYMRLLGWEKSFEEEGYWLAIEPPGGGTQIAFQTNELFEPPVWPEVERGPQQQMLHMDFEVQNKAEMARAVEHALSCGATVAKTQYSDEWVVLLDPVGHPFCFVVWEKGENN